MTGTKTAIAAALGILLVVAGEAAERAGGPPERAPTPVVAAPPAVAPAATAHADAAVSTQALTGVVQRYCQVCHNDQLLTGSLSLQGFDVAQAAEKADVSERMIRKLRAGMMPPPGMPRPGGDTMVALVETLEKIVDEEAEDAPNPGTRRFQRLNRPEYQQAIRNLLELEVEPGAWLPLDTTSDNFDNIADAQALSPTLLEAY